MNRKRVWKMMAGTRTAVVAVLLLGAFVFALVNAPHSKVPRSPAFQLTAGSGFSITGTIGTTRTGNTCSGGPAILAPGVTRCVLYRITNPLDVPITVTSITGTAISFTPAHTHSNLPACTPTEVKVTPFSGRLPVGPKSSTTLVESIVLETLTTTQDNCEGGTFTLDYESTATFTDATTTVLKALPTSTTQGSPVTFTASVKGTNPTLDTHSPVGTVRFYSCTTSDCLAPILITTKPLFTSGGNRIATLTTSLLPPGTLYFEAKYLGTGPNQTNFSPSTSNLVTLTVEAPVSSCMTAPTSKATKVITGKVTGNLNVAPFTSVWLDGGTITGSVQVDFLGSFSATNATIDGSLNSAGLVSLQGSTVKGSVNAAGALGIGPGTVIGKDLNADFALALCAVGTTASPITVGGSVNVHGLPVFFSLAKLCGMSVTDKLTYSFNAAPVEIGAASGCPGDVIKGGLTVQHNTKVTVDTDSVGVAGAPDNVTVSDNGGVTVASNTVHGNVVVEHNGIVTITGNTVTGNITVAYDGGGTLTSNKATGTCSLGPDHPFVTGSGNTYKMPPNTCNGKA